IVILHVHGFSSYFNDFLAYEFDKECLKPLLLLDFLIVQQALLTVMNRCSPFILIALANNY
ncbi:hypothetical protein ACFPXP_10690, partial [Marinicrinis lubricantis]